MNLRQCQTLFLFLLVQNFKIPAVLCFSLYGEQNHSELIEEFTFYTGEFCKNLKKSEAVVRSVDTLGNCYVLYEIKGCDGKWAQVFSREFAYNNMEMLVSSIGVCATTVDLYSGKNNQGYKERVHVFGDEDCVTVGKRWNKRPIESVNTNGGCVLLHDGPNCDGHSLQIKAGSNTNQNLQKWNFRHNIKSMSPCTYFDSWRSKEDAPIPFVLYSKYDTVSYEGTSQTCSCQTIDKFKRNAHSVATNGHCVILYQNENCSGHRIKLIPSNGFYPDLDEYNFSGNTSSVSSCDIKTTCPVNPNTIVYSNAVLFGEYIREKDSVVIKTENIPPFDYFCELTRRCTGNRNFDCSALENEKKCYCSAARKVSCDSGTFPHLNSKNFKKDETFRFPLAGEFDTKGRHVALMSSSYEAPFVQFCELFRRCDLSGGKCPGQEDDIGGQGIAGICYVDKRSVSTVAPAGSGIKARPSTTVDEDEDFASLSDE